MSFIPYEIIKKKRQGLENTEEEIQFFVRGFTDNTIPDYQMSAWIMAICFQGMSAQETACLTYEMTHSGSKFDFSNIKVPKVDKHSTGGVGDKTSMIIAPIIACFDITNPMIAGRGLGHTGGTLDKLESIPGFNVKLTMEEFQSNIEKYGFSIMGQTKEICPADRKLYALRDVTATIDSLPLICGSIMSKKLCEDLDALVLDIKYGSGAFMSSVENAEKLASLLIDTGKRNDVEVSAFVTNMNQPLGRYSGNSLEMKECIDILKNESCIENGYDFYDETRELSLQLCAEMVLLAKKANDFDDAYAKVKEKLENGEAFKKFLQLCEFQGPAKLEELPTAQYSEDIVSTNDGFVSSMNTEKLGFAGVELGAGRKKSSDEIDPSAGIEFFKKVGHEVKKGEKIAKIYGNRQQMFETTRQMIIDSIVIASEAPREIPELIAKRIRG